MYPSTMWIMYQYWHIAMSWITNYQDSLVSFTSHHHNYEEYHSRDSNPVMAIFLYFTPSHNALADNVTNLHDVEKIIAYTMYDMLKLIVVLVNFYRAPTHFE